MEVEAVSQEAIQKALETLGLSKSAEPEAEVEQPVVSETDKQKAELQKALEETLAKAEEIKNKIAGRVEESKPIVKAEVSEEIVKGFESKVDALGLLVQSKDQKIAELQKAIDSVNEFNQALGKKIGLIEKQPLDRKSVSTQTFLEKGGEGAANPNTQVKTFSLSDKKQRNQLADIMFKAAINPDGKGVKDEEFAKAVPCVELGSLGRTPQEAQALSVRLLNEHKIVVTK